LDFRSSSEYDRIALHETFRRRAPLQGCVPFSTCRHREATDPNGTSVRLRCAFRVSTLLTLYSSRSLTAVFQTAALLGFFPSKVSPSTAGAGLSTRLARLASARTDPLTRAVRCPRPPSGLCSPWKSVAASPEGETARASLGISSPPGAPSPRDDSASAVSPPSGLGRRPQPPIRPLGVSFARSLEALRREPHPLLGFPRLVPASRASAPNRSQRPSGVRIRPPCAPSKRNQPRPRISPAVARTCGESGGKTVPLTGLVNRRSKPPLG
jgi:hypothetical protein